MPELKKSDESKKVAFFQTKAKSENGKIKVCITKQIRDRDGEVLLIDGANLENYNKNPIMIWGHRMNYGDVEDVMGRLDNLKQEQDEDGTLMLVGEPTFADHPKAKYLEKMVRDGIISTVSVGASVPQDGYDPSIKALTSWELLEVSWVMVPANTEANVKSKSYHDEKDFEEDVYKKLLNYDDVHKKIKQYRKLFMSDEFCDLMKYTKTGNELEDLKNIFDLTMNLTKVKPEETPKAVEVVKETPLISKDELVRLIS